MTDIRFENHDSIWLACGVSNAGRDWLDENVEFDVGAGRVGAIEPRSRCP